MTPRIPTVLYVATLLAALLSAGTCDAVTDVAALLVAADR